MKGHKPAHLVKRVTLEFEIENQAEAGWFQNEMSRLFNTYLQQSLEKILDEYDVEDYVIRLDTLDLDLGDVPVDFMDRQITKRFEDALRRALHDKLGAATKRPPTHQPHNVQVLPLFPARLEMLQRYLLTGQSTSGYKVQNKSMEEIFLELLQENEVEVRAMLVEAVRQGRQVLERIAFQFHSRSLEQIYKMFAPAFRSFISAQEQELVAIITTRVTQHHGAAVRTVRRAILEYLLAPARRTFETSEFRKEIAAQLLRDLGEPVKVAFREYPEFFEGSSDTAMTESKRMEEAVRIIKAFLQSSSLPTDRMVLVQAWEFLSLEAPKQLAQLISRGRPDVKQIVTLVEILPPLAVTDFLERAVPNQAQAISMILAEVVAVFQVYANARAGTTDVRNQTLAQLLLYASSITDKPQQFSPKEAVKRIDQTLKSNPDIPKELKKALERQDLPGISELIRNDLQLPSVGEERPAGDRAEEQKSFEEAKARFQEEQEQIVDLSDGSVKDPEIKRRQAEREKLLEQDEAYEKEAEEDLIEAEDDKAVDAKPASEAELAGESEADEKAAISEEEEPADKTKEEKLAEESRKDEKQQEKALEPDQEGAEKPEKEEGEDVPVRRPAEQRATEVPVTQKDDVAQYLDTVTGRLAYLAYFIRHGEEPWWAGPADSTRVELFFSSLLKLAPEGLKEVFLKLVQTSAPAALDKAIARVHALVGGKLILKLIQEVLPEIGGLSVLIREAMTAYVTAPPSGFSLPSYVSNARGLVLHHVLKFALIYQNSTPNAQTMVRYVVKELAEATGQPARVVIKDIIAILDERIGKGERKFIPLKTLLPMSFMEIVVEAPKPLETPPSTIKYLSAVEIAALEAEIALETAKTEDTSTGPEAETAKESQPSPKAKSESEAAKEEEARKVQAAFEEKEMLRDAFRFDEGKVQEEEPSTHAEPELPEEEVRKQAEEAKKELAEFLARQSSAPLPLALRYLAQPEEGVKLVKHYLETGTLPGDFPVTVSREQFKVVFTYLLDQHRGPMVSMLKRILMDRMVRLRLVREMAPMFELIVKTVAPFISDVLLPFAEALAELASGSGSPISKEAVLEHALAYVVRVRGEIFSPLDYVRSLIQYALNQTQVEPRALVSFLETRLEQRQIPQKFALQQVLQTVRATSAPPKAVDPDKPKKAAPKFKPLDDDYFVANAGVVLVWPFFGQLFGFLKLLSPDKKSFLDDEKQAKAAHLIQYLISKEINVPEENMVLNKVLVGMNPDDTLMEIDELTQEETDLIDEMLGVAAERSGLVKGPHGEALRETFMEREGKLKKEKDGWNLKVQAKAYDLLLGRLQWGLNPVRLPWLKVKFQIDWK